MTKTYILNNCFSIMVVASCPKLFSAPLTILFPQSEFMASEAVLAASLDKKKVGLVGIYGSKEDMITFYKASIVSYFLSPFKKDITEA